MARQARHATSSDRLLAPWPRGVSAAGTSAVPHGAGGGYAVPISRVEEVGCKLIQKNKVSLEHISRGGVGFRIVCVCVFCAFLFFSSFSFL